MKRFSFNLRSKKTAFVVAAAVAVLGIGLLGYNKVFAGTTRDCSGNSIDYKNLNGGCGAANPSEFIKDVQANNPNDLKTIYSHFGLQTNEYNRFVSSARMGMAYMDGTIKVDGQTVATNAWSIGRTNFGYTSPYKIAGKTYQKAADTRVLLSNIPVMVLFNSKGEMEFAVMTACGNPAEGTHVTPKYSCDLLQKTHVSGNTYSFTTKASASQNAKVEKVIYSFGDGTSFTATSLTQKVNHTYATSGTFTATVKVIVSVPGKQTVTVTSANCETKITITPPPKPFEQCVSLNATVVDEKKHSYKFVATTNQGNGATLKDANFSFGDGTSANGVKPSGTSAVTSSHTYGKTGTFTIKAVVNFNTKDGVKSADCQTTVTIKEQPKPYQECVALDGFVTDNQQRSVKLTVTTKQGNGSTLKSADFNFGDGKTAPAVSPASATTVIANHTFAAAGSYTVVATVHFNTPNGVVSSNCQTKIQFSETPAPVCNAVDVTKTGGRAIDVLVHYTANGAALQSVTYDFGDGSKPMVSTSNAATYTYAKDGTFKITAALKFVANGKEIIVSGENCGASVTFTTPTCTAPNGTVYPEGSAQCHPTCTDVNGNTHPAGSTECENCTAPNGQTYMKGDEHCQPKPTTLVNTGPGSVAGLFVGTSAIGAIAYRWFIGRKLIRG
ncbi:MAG TPA: PKD domain-containing protein [Candidatus Saccharimonadales bacterium]|nr:PKD domain-containing protein [Candidatus Saccharimonadales bacterium]